MTTTIRRARPSDGSGVAEFLEGLSAETAFRRFFTGLGRPPRSLSERLILRDADHGVWVAVEDGKIVGHVSWTRDRSEPVTDPDIDAQGRRSSRGPVYELAVVVADVHQRHGLGTQLVLRAAHEAAEAGARTLRFVVHGDNRDMVRWLTRLFPTLAVTFEGGVMVCDVDASSATLDGSVTLDGHRRMTVESVA